MLHNFFNNKKCGAHKFFTLTMNKFVWFKELKELEDGN